ncbi:uncharacterized protein N0V89_000063 [Didymosphaeria variabile]|uniref:Uncharacterized protein n=1 Tax=Didymosphaeria variabile TaxID=1932322 RepID=A0A9W9CEK9_9PLEO|nr:uncharacterized protein N0V89_000063 [Didymosphaeria variabile]KAJ4359508.1 hypothetical protein N0V89_000063 [Didymosphaeria variabile]
MDTIEITQPLELLSTTSSFLNTFYNTIIFDMAGPMNNPVPELKFEMKAPIPVESIPATPSKTGIKLRINFKNSTIRVINPKKRDADDLDEDTQDGLAAFKAAGISAARIEGYTKDELDVALTLASMKDGPPARKRVKSTPAPSSQKMRIPDAESDGRDATESVGAGADGIILKATQATRKQRIVDPTHPADALMILATSKAGFDIYDSDAESVAGDVSTSVSTKPELFRNVTWGPAANDTSNDAAFPTEPSFDQFVPGRWERLPDGTIRDQKHKLIVRLTSKDGRKMLFKNPPPKDWNDQKAITCLNKRVSQQIRRNTAVRFRLEVESYVHEERVWINEHLTNGKPGNGWKAFVEEFNEQFAGEMLEGCEGVRPTRTHSSLTKEVERFGKEFYAQGKVPVLKEGKQGKSKAE